MKECKRIFSLILVLGGMVMCCAGCAGQPEAKQEPTNKLVVYGHPEKRDWVDYAVYVYKRQYPDVEVDYQAYGNAFDPYTAYEHFDEYKETLIADINAGKGPDVVLHFETDFWAHWSEFDDVYKAMDSGAFADINTYLEDDPEFDAGEFNQTVLDGGIYKGKRLLMPVMYRSLPLLTTEEKMDALGVELSEPWSMADFVEQIDGFVKRYGDDRSTFLFLDGYRTIRDWVFPWCGVQAVDYETKRVLVDSEDFRMAMELCKAIYPVADKRLEGLRNGAAMLEPTVDGALFAFGRTPDMYAHFQSWQTHQKHAVMSHIPNPLGKNTATALVTASIRKSSPNQVNAYNFIKVLLSEEVQGFKGENLTIGAGLPVRNTTLARQMDECVVFYGKEEYVPEADITRYPVPKEAGQTYLSMLAENTVYVNNYSTAVMAFIYEAMTPYFEGEKEYEPCLAALKNKLQLYIGE